MGGWVWREKRARLIADFRSQQIPDGHCWLAGDNAPWSRDSRDYGPLPLGLIRGKTVARIWPLPRIGWIKNTLREAQD
jgi:inner membrane protease subunit 1